MNNHPAITKQDNGNNTPFRDNFLELESEGNKNQSSEINAHLN